MSKVIIQECKDYVLEDIMEKINDGIEKLGGWDLFVKPGDTVLLKANLIGPKTSDTAAVTHSEFVRAITKILKGRGCTVWIGEADVVINLPKLKTHSANVYTGAVKNLFGCIPGLRKATYHKMAPDKEDFGDIIADIHQATKFSLHIMDSITSMEGEGPTAGSVYKSNKILISTDPLALDAVALNMLGLTVDDVPIIIAAKKRNLGQWNLEDIIIEGDYDSIPKLNNFKLPKVLKSSKQKSNKAVVKVIDFFKTVPEIDTNKCKKCNMCVESCPMQAIDRATKKIDYSKCIECMCCHELCLHKAVRLKKNNIIADVIARLSLR